MKRREKAEALRAPKAPRRIRRLSRRQFLTTGAMAGLAVGAPGWLAGCGSDDGGAMTRSATPAPTPPGHASCAPCTSILPSMISPSRS
jgi:hypothetical protein